MLTDPQKVEPKERHFRENFAFPRDGIWHHPIERADPIGCDHHQTITQVIQIADFSPLAWKTDKFCFQQGIHTFSRLSSRPASFYPERSRANIVL
ncbi:MAG: hypothetical protein LW700_04615 [Gemmataceae bacterium]|nr:hypothetical protein [Gemmataceae bacterium]